MERRFVIWLHPPFCNVISLNITPLKLFLTSNLLTQLIYIIAKEENYFIKKRRHAHLELKKTKNITHFLLLKAHPH